MATVAMVLTVTRSGRRTSEARPSSSTAPPIMMMGGRMESHRMEGTAMVFEAAWATAPRVAITCPPPRHP